MQSLDLLQPVSYPFKQHLYRETGIPVGTRHPPTWICSSRAESVLPALTAFLDCQKQVQNGVSNERIVPVTLTSQNTVLEVVSTYVPEQVRRTYCSCVMQHYMPLFCLLWQLA